jgi:hypothetical protein
VSYEVLAAIAGFYLGRWTAEVRRSKYDAERAWRSRKNYRDE